MKRGWCITFAAGALAAASGSPALADDRARGAKSKAIEDPARVGRPGETPTDRARREGTAAKKREVSGTVVKADGRTVFLEHMGAIVPLEIDEKTEFVGEGLESSRDLVEGQSVRASFTVEKETRNVAEEISLATASERVPTESGPQERPSPRGEGTPSGYPPIPPERGPGIPPDRQPVPGDPGERVPRDPGGPTVPKY